MNKIYKVVWSKAKQAYIVVSEIAHSHSKAHSSKQILASVLAGTLILVGTSNVSYADDGKVLAGSVNTASGAASSVTGGGFNKASGRDSSISGGHRSIASGEATSISGGYENAASGYCASVSGGDNNVASGNYASISGGCINTASGCESSVSGGMNNTASGLVASISGGDFNIAWGRSASVSGGQNNIALGNESFVAGGKHNIALEDYSSALGGESGLAMGQGSVVIGGGTTVKDAIDAVAIGSGAVVTTKQGTAVGYQSTTDEPGTIAFGHDAGDISGYTLTWKRRTDTDSDGHIVKNADGTTNDYTKDPTVTRNKYSSAWYNRLVKVADGQSAHDVATVGQTLELVAGDHVTIADDTTKTNSIGQQRKKISIITDGVVAENNTGIVTGGTVYSALNAETTARQNADTTLTNNVTDLTSKVTTLTTDMSGKADTNLSNLTDAGKTVIKNTMIDDLAKKANVAEVYKKSETYNRTEVDSKVSRLTTDMAGKADSSLSNLTDVGKNIIKTIMADDMAKKAATDASNIDTAAWGQKLDTGKIAYGDQGLISGGKVFAALQNVGNYGLVKSDSHTVTIAKDDPATVVSVAGKKQNRVVTGVKTDASDPSSAANVAYVNENANQIYQDMNNAYGSLKSDINRAAAGSNALAALKPMEFDSDDKLQFGVGYGHYRNANAAAVGAFYQPDANCMVNLGATLGNGNPGISAGVTIKFGRGGSGAPAMSKRQMAQVIQNQITQLNEQSKEIEMLKSENKKMQEQIRSIMENLKNNQN